MSPSCIGPVKFHLSKKWAHWQIDQAVRKESLFNQLNSSVSSFYPDFSYCPSSCLTILIYNLIFTISKYHYFSQKKSITARLGCQSAGYRHIMCMSSTIRVLKYKKKEKKKKNKKSVITSPREKKRKTKERANNGIGGRGVVHFDKKKKQIVKRNSLLMSSNFRWRKWSFKAIQPNHKWNDMTYNLV